MTFRTRILTTLFACSASGVLATMSISSACTVLSTTIGSSPFFNALLPKMSANDVLTTARNPNPVNAHGACSREEPQPKLSPAMRICAPAAPGVLSTKSGLGDPSAL